MEKDQLKKLLEEYGDAIIDFRSLNSGRMKYNVCTTDFTTPYIQEKRNRTKETDETVLTFCWDTDSFRLVRPDLVIKVRPLSEVLKNGDNE